MVLFDRNDVKTVFSREGPHPKRPTESFEVVRTWRNSHPEFFVETNGLLFEEGENWKKLRSKIQVELMHPKARHFYLKKVQPVADDFIKYLRKRNESSEDFMDGKCYNI